MGQKQQGRELQEEVRGVGGGGYVCRRRKGHSSKGAERAMPWSTCSSQGLSFTHLCPGYQHYEEDNSCQVKRDSTGHEEFQSFLKDTKKEHGRAVPDSPLEGLACPHGPANDHDQLLDAKLLSH